MNRVKKAAFLFPGQGSQSPGMGRDFFEASPVARQMVEEGSERLKIDFKKLLFEEDERLEKTEFTQPAILLVSAMAHKLFEIQMPIRPMFALGHSLGEFSALVSVGALDFLDGLELVNKRGELMQAACEGKDAAMMAVLGLEDEVVERLCAEARVEGRLVWPANYNGDGQIVIAGKREDLLLIEPRLKDAKAKRVLLLNMSVASHCPLLESARPPLVAYLKQFVGDEFLAPVISNVTAKPYSTKDEAIRLLDRQLVEPVLYKQSVRSIEEEVDLFIEFGNGSVLGGLNKRLIKKPTFSVGDMASLERVVAELVGGAS